MRSLFILLFLTLVLSNSQAQEDKITAATVKEYLIINYESNSVVDSIPATMDLSLRGDPSSDVEIILDSLDYVSGAEPSIAVNPHNSDHIIISYIATLFDGRADSRCPIFVTFDGGLSWELSEFDKESIFHDDFPDHELFTEGDPVLAFDDEGKIYYTWLSIGKNANGALLITTYWACSHDNGKSFQVDELIENRLLSAGTQRAGEGRFIDRPWLAVDKSQGPNKGTVYIQGRIFNSGLENELLGDLEETSVLLYKSPNSRQFESYRVDLDSLVDEAYTQYAHLSVDMQGLLHSSFGGYEGSLLDEDYRAYHLTSDDLGESFTSIDPVTNFRFKQLTSTVHNRENPMPDAAVHPLLSSIHYTYTEDQDSILLGFYVTSSDNGLTWSEPQDIQSLTQSDLEQTMWPTIAVDENSGLLSIGYFGMDINNTGDYYLIFSDDNGESWSEPCKLSSMSTEFGRPFEFFFGDYWESKIVDDISFCVWADRRTEFKPRVYFSKVVHSEVSLVSEHSPVTDRLKITNLYPNPTTSELQIIAIAKNPSQAIISLLDSQGRKIASVGQVSLSEGVNEIEFQVDSTVPSGQYLISIDTPYGNYLRKFILVE